MLLQRSLRIEGIGDQNPRMLWISLSTIVAGCTFLFATGSSGVEYPTRAIRVVVPQGAGGSTDLTARVMAQHLAEVFGQSVVVDNRPGAGSINGTDH